MSEPLAVRQADALRKLRQRFEATIGNTLDAFRQLADRLAETPDAPELLDALRRELHRVHGTAGSYGFTEASHLAGQVEARAVRWSRDPALELRDRSALMHNFVTALDAAFRQQLEPGSAEPADAVETRSRIVLVGAAPTVRDAMRAEAAMRGFQLTVLETDGVSPDALRALAPVLIATPAELAPDLADVAWTLSVPLLALEFRPRELRTGAPTGDGSYQTLELGETLAPVFDVVERAAARAGRGGLTILALDDDPAILAMVQYILERPGLTVRTIATTADLLPALERWLPSLLISDISMPGATGIDVTRQLRADPRYRDLPIVLLSSETDAVSREDALRAGADEFVSKPIAAAELRHRIADRLDRHRLQRLAAGSHPVTGLSVGPRAAREAAEAFARLADADAPCTVAVMSPDATADEADEGWLREALRVTRDLAAELRYGGHDDDGGLLLVLGTDAASATGRLAGLAGTRPAEATRWRAGLIDRDELSRTEITVARRSALEALDVARTLEDDAVHRWQRDEALIAPDVIVVEDDPALSDMLQYALKATGFTFRAFGNGRLALDYLLAATTQGRRPIVLLDVDLPGMDGYSLHERLSVARAGDYAVVFVTVHGAESDQLRALKGGAIDFVIKPLNLRILMAKMSSWAAASRSAGVRR